MHHQMMQWRSVRQNHRIHQIHHRSCHYRSRWNNCSDSYHISQLFASRCSPQWNSVPFSLSTPSLARTQPHRPYYTAIQASPSKNFSKRHGIAYQKASSGAISIPACQSPHESFLVAYENRYRWVGSSSEKAWLWRWKQRWLQVPSVLNPASRFQYPKLYSLPRLSALLHFQSLTLDSDYDHNDKWQITNSV